MFLRKVFFFLNKRKSTEKIEIIIMYMHSKYPSSKFTSCKSAERLFCVTKVKLNLSFET